MPVPGTAVPRSAGFPQAPLPAHLTLRAPRTPPMSLRSFSTLPRLAPAIAPAAALVGLLAAATPALAQGGIDSASARYQVSFDATWSSQSHPNAYPSSAHFSPLIGATHNDSVSLWGPGALATQGIEQMAETGGVSSLVAEVNSLISSGQAGQVVSGGGVGVSPGSAIGFFNIDQDHSLVSLVTMIAPSPDWFVGVHDLDLFAGGQWVESLEVPLFAYDAGTDSGPEFFSPNSDTQPAEGISLLTGGPFTGATPLGTFRFERMVGAVVFGPNPNGSLIHESGLPFLGANVNVRFTDPSLSFPTSSIVLAGLSGQAQASLFDGLPLPGFGLQPGTSGALLLQDPFEFLSAPSISFGSSDLTLNVPNSAVLAGATFYVQGVLIDPTNLRAGLTQGLQLNLGN